MSLFLFKPNNLNSYFLYIFAVAPYAGAWIEREDSSRNSPVVLVAPYAGAWIERRRYIDADFSDMVAPYAGAWIERHLCGVMPGSPHRRSLRGSVD